MQIKANKHDAIAIVHDAFIVSGGAERLAYYLSQIYPEAPIYTSIYQPAKTFPELRSKRIITHPFNNLIKSEKVFKQLYPLWFFYFNQLNLSAYDMILSSSTYLAKFISHKSTSKHICYMHSPFRFLWKRNSYSDESLPYNKAAIRLIDTLTPHLRKIDFSLTQRIDGLITNSQNMANHIKSVYQKEAEIIHPPVNIEEYYIQEPQDYYLCVSRLMSYKKIDLAILACNQLNKKLIIVGEGPERQKWEKMAGPTVHFVGRVNDATLKNYYATCKALIFPGIEDFGMVPIEVQASGRPVIAYRAGGVLETVIENQTGIFFDQQNVESLVQAIIQFEKSVFVSSEIRASVQRFDFSEFKSKIETYINQVV